jgi:hypothetical protein
VPVNTTRFVEIFASVSWTKIRVGIRIIAVCSKLLKQGFAMAKSRLIGDKKYKSTSVKN